MNEIECIKAYELLIQTLEESGYAWVVAQVREEIKNGKTGKKEVKVPKETSSEQDNDQGKSLQTTFFPEEQIFKLQNDNQKGTKASLITSLEYTPRQSLGLLLDSINKTLLDVPDMEIEIVTLLKDHQLAGSIIFYNDEEELNVVAKIPVDSIDLLRNSGFKF